MAKYTSNNPSFIVHYSGISKALDGIDSEDDTIVTILRSLQMSEDEATSDEDIPDNEDSSDDDNFQDSVVLISSSNEEI